MDTTDTTNTSTHSNYKPKTKRKQMFEDPEALAAKALEEGGEVRALPTTPLTPNTRALRELPDVLFGQAAF